MPCFMSASRAAEGSRDGALRVSPVGAIVVAPLGARGSDSTATGACARLQTEAGAAIECQVELDVAAAPQPWNAVALTEGRVAALLHQ